MSVDYVLHNGTFITLNDKQPFASAIAVKKGKIFKIGSFDYIKPHINGNTKVLDLQGKTVIPGFVDSHIHLISLGLDMQVVDLRGFTSKLELLSALVRIQRKIPPGNWIKGYGFDETRLDDLPKMKELDKISNENPLYLEGIDSKICIVNSLALEKVEINPDVEGVKFAKGKNSKDFTGIIRVSDEKNLYKVVNIPTLDPVDNTLNETELELAIELASKKAVEAGITSIHDPQLPPNALRAFKNVVNDQKISLRSYLGCDRNREIYLQEYIDEGVGTEINSNRLKMGMVKLFADGRISIEELKKRVKEAHEEGLQLSIHATNPDEIRHALNAIEEALEDIPRNDHRHRIEHADIIDKELLEKVAKLNVIISAQPELVFKLEPKYPNDSMCVAYNSMINKGIRVTGGSDSPTVPIIRRARRPLTFPTPLLGICFLSSRETENGIIISRDERVSVLDSLRIYTINGAYASFEENMKGTLEEGKLSDLVVLSENPLKTKPELIKNIEVEMTMIGGKIVFSKDRNF